MKDNSQAEYPMNSVYSLELFFTLLDVGIVPSHDCIFQVF